MQLFGYNGGDVFCLQIAVAYTRVCAMLLCYIRYKEAYSYASEKHEIALKIQILSYRPSMCERLIILVLIIRRD